MCGIVGYLGAQNSIPVVIEGLERLEYRGYDSAGISFVSDQGNLEMYKKEGKIENLKEVLSGLSPIGRACIGHTRWATHGEVNDVNAHPHMLGDISMVHNGIIENAQELKESLESRGHKFLSETDSEVFINLLTEEVEKEGDFKKALTSTFKQITGNSAFVILNSKNNEIFAIKRGAPLVCGLNVVTSEAMVSSDPYALAGRVEKLYFPQDETVCHLSAANKNLINFYDLNLEKTKNYLSKNQDITATVNEKGNFEHFMLKEIHEQPELIRSLTEYYFSGEGRDSLKSFSGFNPGRIIISACGTAYYAGLCVRDYIEKNNRIPCHLEFASEFRYRNPILLKNDVALFVSQSGETADTLAAQSLCKENNVKTISIVNVEGSTLFRECDHNLLIRAGVEIGVASTKAFTQQVLTGVLLSHAMKGDLNSDTAKVNLSSQFSLLAERLDMMLAKESEIQDIANEIYNYNGYFYTGRGLYYPSSLEGALKLKEIAYVHAEGYAAGELKHGPIALIDEHIVNIAIVGPELYDKAISNIQEIKARKGISVVLGPENDERLKKISDYYIPLNFEGLGDLSPLYVNVANQLLAYYMAKFKGTDIDKPRNLAKSVTVE